MFQGLNRNRISYKKKENKPQNSPIDICYGRAILFFFFFYQSQCQYVLSQQVSDSQKITAASVYVGYAH